MYPGGIKYSEKIQHKIYSIKSTALMKKIHHMYSRQANHSGIWWKSFFLTPKRMTKMLTKSKDSNANLKVVTVADLRQVKYSKVCTKCWLFWNTVTTTRLNNTIKHPIFQHLCHLLSLLCYLLQKDFRKKMITCIWGFRFFQVRAWETPWLM